MAKGWTYASSLTTPQAMAVGRAKAILDRAEKHPENYPNHFVSIHLHDLAALVSLEKSHSRPVRDGGE